MVNNVLRLTVWSENDGVVTGAENITGMRSQYPWASFITRVGVGAEYVVGNSIVYAVVLSLPAPTTVKAVIATCLFANTRAFQRVPIINSTIHRAVCKKPLPITTSTQDN